MRFWKTVLSIARRKLVGPPIILLALIAAGVAYYVTPTHYVSSGYMVLTTPTAGVTVDPSKPNWTTNPLLQFNDGLKTTAAILIQSMNTREAATRLGAPPGGPTKITVNDGTTVSKVMQSSATGPFIYVEVDSTRRTGVRELVLNVERTLRYDLYTRQRQLKAPKSTYLTLSDVVPPSEPEAKNVTKWEYAGAALALVLVLGFGIAYGFDRRAAARRRSPHPYDDFGGTSLPALTYRHARPAGAPLLATPVPQPGVSEKSSRSDSVPARRPPRELEETAEFQVVFDDEPGAETNETNKTNKTSEKNEKNEKDEKDEEKEPAPDATVPDLRTVSKTPEQRSRPFKVLGSAADDDGAADGSDGHGGGVAAPRAG